MKKRISRASHNRQEGEAQARNLTENTTDQVVNITSFVVEKSNAKSPIQDLIKDVCREINRNKFNYLQLKPTFRTWRV